MVCGAKKIKRFRKVVFCVAFIFVVGGILAGCDGLEAEMDTDIEIGAEEDAGGDTDVIGQEKNLSDNDADDTEQVLIQETGDTTYIQIDFEEFSLSLHYPSSLAEGINAQIIEAGIGPWGGIPEYKLISFDNYLFDRGYIKLIPIEEYSLVWDSAEGEIKKLKDVIETKDITDYKGPHDELIFPQLPYLPRMQDGFQVIYANVELFDSSASQGLRYLTQITGGVLGLIDNSMLTYVYLGITTDQKYYVRANFPVNYPRLPYHNEGYLESKGINSADLGSWDENYENYQNVTTQMLDEANPEDFEPSLLLLDEIIKSFQID